MSSVKMERQFPMTSPFFLYFEKSIGASAGEGVEVVVVLVVVVFSGIVVVVVAEVVVVVCVGEVLEVVSDVVVEERDDVVGTELLV